jgi:riboflavin biosynthesis pyrimidine reductase
MVSSVDGRILSSRMRPKGANSGGLFERLHDELKGDAWLIGRVTGREFAKRESYPAQAGQTFPREHWFARRDAAAWGIALDRHGKIAWGRSDIGGDPIVVVLSEQVSDAHLAGLRSEQVSYIFAGKHEIDLVLAGEDVGHLFAGKHEIDLGLALEILNRELGIKRLLLEGGGGSNGAFLRAGLVDEISVAILPAVDGAKGAPSVFDSSDKDAGVPAPIESMTLQSSQVLDGGAVWLRYQLRNS